MNPTIDATVGEVEQEAQRREAQRRASVPDIEQEAQRRSTQQQTRIQENEVPDRAREAETLRYLGEAQKRLPPQQADEIINYSNLLRLPADTVERNLEATRKKVQSTQIDYEGIVRDHPIIAKWIRDPHRSGFVLANELALKQLDAATQGRIDLYPVAQPTNEERLQAGAEGIELGVDRTESRYVEALRRSWSELGVKWNQAKDFLGVGNMVFGTVGGAGVTARDMTPDEAKERAAQVKALKARGTGEIDFVGDTGHGTLATANKWIQNGLMMPFKDPYMFIGGAAAAGPKVALFGVSAFVRLSAFNASYMLPGIYEKLASMEGPGGEKVDPWAARAAAVPSSILGGMAMSYAFGPVFKSMMAKQVEGMVTAGTDILGSYTLARMIADTAYGYGKHVAVGTLGMGLQAGVDAVTEQMVGSFSLNRPFQARVVAEAMKEGALRGMYDMSALNLWGAGRGLMENAGKFRRAQESYQRSEYMQKGLSAEGMTPERQADFLRQSAMQPGAAKHLYVDLVAMEEHALANGLDIKEVLKAVGLDHDQLAAKGVDDIAIPIEKAGKLLLNKKWSDFAKNEGRYHPNDESLGTLVRDLKSLNESIDADLAKPVEQWDPEHKQIYDHAFAQAHAALSEGFKGTDRDVKFEADAYARSALKGVRLMEAQGGATAKAFYERLFHATEIRFVGPPKVSPDGTIQEGGYSARQDLISLFTTSTPFALPHEFGHKFVSSLGEAAALDPTLKPEYDRWAKAMGYESGDARDRGLIPANEEKLGYSVAAYFAEGISPSADMAAVLDRFRGLAHEWASQQGEGASLSDAFMANWRKIQPEGASIDALAAHVPDSPARTEDAMSKIPPEMRERLDTLFRSMTEIELAQKEAKLTERMDKVYERLSAPEQELYAKLVGESTVTAHEILQKWILARSRSENKEFFKKERERFAEEAIDEMKRSPVYRLLHFWRTGEMWEGPKQTTYTPVDTERASPAMFDAATLKDLLTDANGKPFKISESSILEQFPGKEGQEFAASLNELRKGTVVKNEERGQPLSLFAELMGIPMDKFVAELRMARPENDAINRKVEMRMQQKYGDALMRDPEGIKAAAMDAAHNAKVGTKILMEIRALRRDLDPARAMRMETLDKEGMREFAEESLKNGAYRDVDPEKFIRGERVAFEQATRYLEEGNIGRAYDALEKRLRYYHLYRAATGMEKSLDSLIDRMTGKSTDPKWLGKLGDASPAYRDLVMELMKELGVRNRPENEVLKPGLVDDFVKAMRDSGEADKIQAIDVEVLRKVLEDPKRIEGEPFDWKSLPTAEAKALWAAVEGIHDLASAENTATYERERASVRELWGKMQEHLDPLGKKYEFTSDRSTITLLQKMGKMWRGNMAGRVDPHGLLMRLGKVGELIENNFRHSLYSRDALTREVHGFLQEITKILGADSSWHTELQGLTDILPRAKGQGPLTKKWLANAMLWYGGETTRKGLLDANPQWAHSGKDANANILEAAEKFLTPQDMQAIQKFHELSEKSLWQHEAKMHEWRTGMPLKKELAAKYTVNGVEYAGGYFPRFWEVSAEQSAKAIETPGRAPKATTRHSYSYERDLNYTGIPDLNFDRYPSHIAETIHDVTMGRFVHETAKIVADYRGVAKEMISNSLGPEIYSNLEAWLTAVGTGGHTKVPAHLREFDKVMEWSKNRLVVGALGWNVPVAWGNMLHAVGANLIAEGVQAYRMIPTLAHIMSKEGKAFLAEHAMEANRREEDLSTKMADQYRQLMTHESWATETKRKIADTAFVFIAASDKVQSRWMWATAYDHEMGRSGDHEKAKDFANIQVARHMPSHDVIDMPTILRDRKFLGRMTIFAGFNSKVFNVMDSVAHEMIFRKMAEHGAFSAEFGGSAVAFGARAMAAMLVWSALGDFVMGHGKEKDETWEDFTLRKALAAPSLGFPVINSAIKAGADLAVTGKLHGQNVMQAPQYTMVYQGLKLGQAIFGKNTTNERKGAAALEALFFAAGLPAIQPVRTGRAALNMWNDTGPQDPWQQASDLVYGKRRTITPLSAMGEGR